MKKNKIDVWTILQDISAIVMGIVIPLYILLQIIKGINYFESLSIEWWMVLSLVLVMVRGNVMELGELDRLKKYLEPIVSRIVVTRKAVNQK